MNKILNEFQFPEFSVNFISDFKSKEKILISKGEVDDKVILTAWIALIYRYTKQKDIVIVCENENNVTEFSLIKITIEKCMAIKDIFNKITSDSMNNKTDISKENFLKEMEKEESYFVGFFQKEHLIQAKRFCYLTYEEPYLYSNFIRDEYAKQISSHLTELIKNFEINNSIQIEKVDFLTEEERNDIFIKFNNTYKNYEKACIHSLFEKQAAKTPNLIAAKYEGETLTYKELNEKSNQLARYLKKNGVGIGDFVAISLDRSLEMIIGLLSILKAGAVYVPVDPSLPETKINYILDDTKASIILINKTWNYNCLEIDALCIDTINYSDESISNLDLLINSEDLMYVIYTSGSTGNPKGVMVQHGAVANRLIWMGEYYGFNSKDIILQKTPFSFDVSVWELFLPLIAGARVVFSKPEGHKDSQYLISTIKTEAVTTVHFVPSMLNAFLENEEVGTCITLKRVFCSGEELTKNQQRKFHQLLNSELHNLYGPTEAAIDVTHWTCHSNDHYNYVPIGNPISNMQTLILNSELTPEPKGVTGELYLAGVGLAKGYLNKQELTAKSFIENPFPVISSKKLYKTGDLARVTLENHIEYIGRNDRQVKIRGNRIELTEIEMALRNISDIQDAVVMTKESNSGKKLVAHILKNKKAHLNSDFIRDQLKQSLAQYMIPSLFNILDEWPKTHNGKLDRKKLMNSSPAFNEQHMEKCSETLSKNEVLCHIWSEVLDIPKVNIDDDFFELGGDSILALLIVAKAKKEEIHLELNDLLEKRTIKNIDTSKKTINFEISQNQITGEIFKTPIQNWFFNKDLKIPEHWNMSLILDTPTHINIEVLEKSIQKIIHHHDVLRARFYKRKNEYIPKIEENIDLLFEVKDYVKLTINEQNAEIQKDIIEVQSSLNLEQNLLKALFIKLSPTQSNKLVLVFHHLIMDGVSWRIFIEDLTQVYNQLINDQEVVLPEKTTSYKEWAKKQQDFFHEQKLNIDKYYWTEKFVANEMHIPLTPNEGTEKRAEVLVKLSPIATRKLLKDSLRTGQFKINEILLTPLYLALNSWNEDNHFLIDLEGHGRENIDGTVDLSRTIGWFTSIFPVSFTINNLENKSNIDVLTIISDKLNEIPHKGVGFGILRDFSDEYTQSLIKTLAKPKIKFNYLGQFDNQNNKSIFKINNDFSLNDTSVIENSDYILDVVAKVINGCLEVSFEYYEHNLEKSIIENIANGYLTELNKLLYDLSKKQEIEKIKDSNLKEEDLNKIYSLYK
ncbi:amino acid adenylation domain-containing protein [Lysinibacillus sp. NPDC093190]|uniref:amino acid adenylation domain-containing protein n=1 Tax=Lysinibacillus sp. NPDC093190 TaxID=3390575 RepID=UPI003CFBD20C